MAEKHAVKRKIDLSALIERIRRVPRSLLAAASLVAVLVIVILSVALPARRGESRAVPAEIPEGSVIPARTRSALPAAMLSVPVDASAELRLRTIARRDGFPILSWDIDAFETGADGRMLYRGNTQTLTGIDVSEHQGDINWSAVARDGIDFAMIRMGYRGSTAGGLYEDEQFRANVTGALKAGIPVGVYFYSQAVTVAEAEEEADYVLQAIKDFDITFPVVFDWEIVGDEEARTYSLSRSALCDCTRAFCDKIAQAGYKPMIYFTQYLGYRKYILRNLSDYGFWYAQYEPQPHIAFDFDMWQYSETGTVAGVEGGVDLNILRK